jgi:hypothetical protein
VFEHCISFSGGTNTSWTLLYFASTINISMMSIVCTVGQGRPLQWNSVENGLIRRLPTWLISHTVQQVPTWTMTESPLMFSTCIKIVLGNNMGDKMLYVL